MPARLTRLLCLATVLALAACAGGEDAATDGAPRLEVGEARAAEPVGGASQIVLDVTNRGDADDRLVAVEADAAVAVEIHETRIEEGRASMVELSEVTIPAEATVRFRPGGLHLMLVAPDDSVVLGGTFPVTLHFAASGELQVDVEVVDQLDLAESTFEAP